MRSDLQGNIELGLYSAIWKHSLTVRLSSDSFTFVRSFEELKTYIFRSIQEIAYRSQKKGAIY